jgi:hypothetical protein
MRIRTPPPVRGTSRIAGEEFLFCVAPLGFWLQAIWPAVPRSSIANSSPLAAPM